MLMPPVTVTVPVPLAPLTVVGVMVPALMVKLLVAQATVSLVLVTEAPDHALTDTLYGSGWSR